MGACARGEPKRGLEWNLRVIGHRSRHRRTFLRYDLTVSPGTPARHADGPRVRDSDSVADYTWGMAVTSRRKPGPVPKGARHQFTLRLPDQQYEIYKQTADEAGLSLADYLAAALAKSHGLPVPDYVHRHHGGGDMLPLQPTG